MCGRLQIRLSADGVSRFCPQQPSDGWLPAPLTLRHVGENKACGISIAVLSSRTAPGPGFLITVVYPAPQSSVTGVFVLHKVHRVVIFFCVHPFVARRNAYQYTVFHTFFWIWCMLLKKEATNPSVCDCIANATPHHHRSHSLRHAVILRRCSARSRQGNMCFKST